MNSTEYSGQALEPGIHALDGATKTAYRKHAEIYDNAEPDPNAPPPPSLDETYAAVPGLAPLMARALQLDEQLRQNFKDTRAQGHGADTEIVRELKAARLPILTELREVAGQLSTVLDLDDDDREMQRAFEMFVPRWGAFVERHIAKSKARRALQKIEPIADEWRRTGGPSFEVPIDTVRLNSMARQLERANDSPTFAVNRL